MDKEKLQELGLGEKGIARYCSIFEHSLDAILLASPDGQIHDVNPATCSMFQWSEEELCRIGRAGILDPHNPMLEELMKEREKTGKVRGELTFIRRDGSKFPGEFTSVIFQDEHDFIWTSTIIRDRSIFKEAEECLRRTNEEAIRLANVDYLTGLLNRRAFMERLMQETERAKRENSPMGLLVIDIDFFKEINDTYGHLTGDYVLQKFSASLILNSRPYDVIGRFGGDEFIICLPNASLKESVVVAERIRTYVENLDIIDDNSQLIKLTASFGVADYTHTEDADSLIFRADCAMYQAKCRRNSVSTGDDGLNTRSCQ